MTTASRVAATVVVNTYQQSPTLDILLCALTDQDFCGSWEIVVVDDGSQDETSLTAARHADRMPVPVLYLRQPHLGNRWSRARNLGRRLANGDIIIFLDADTVPDRDVVRLHVEEQTREPALLAGNRLWRHLDTDLAQEDDPGECLARLRAQSGSADPAYRAREEAEARFRTDLVTGPHPWRAWFGCHVSLPTFAEAVFDETMLGWGPADIELALRLNRQGLPVRYLPHARAWHVEREGAFFNPFRSGDASAATEYVRQVCYMIKKHPGNGLAEIIDLGFDRLVLDDDDTWRAVPRGQGGGKRETLDAALAWFSRNHEGASPCTP